MVTLYNEEAKLMKDSTLPHVINFLDHKDAKVAETSMYYKIQFASVQTSAPVIIPNDWVADWFGSMENALKVKAVGAESWRYIQYLSYPHTSLQELVDGFIKSRG